MDRFRLVCDFVFEAKDVTDAFIRLTDHFSKSAMNQPSSLKLEKGILELRRIVPNIIASKLKELESE